MAPNILLFITDDQPAHTMPYMKKTLSRFSSGIEFRRSYVTTPLCAPSRASIQTGRLVRNHDVKVNAHAAKRFRSLGLPKESFGYLLNQHAGYDCGFFGKWTNNYAEVATHRAAGYREWVSILDYGTPIKANINGNVRKTGVPSNQEAQWLAQRAQTFMESAREPWLCVVCPTGPHDPYTPSAAHAHDFDSEPLPGRPNFDYRDPNKPAHVRNIGALTNAEKNLMLTDWRGKLEELMDVDDMVDALVGATDPDDTYCLYTSDNGYVLGEHRLYLKGVPYEESCRVPLHVRGPGVREGAKTDLLAANIDIAPTLLDLAGREPSEYRMDGRSLVGPMFEPDEEAIDWRSSLLFEMAEAGHYEIPWKAVRDARHLYIEHGNGARELYDTLADPYQKSSLQSDPARDEDVYAMADKLGGLRGKAGEDFRKAEGG